ncbi:restriction endonuclease subunit S [Brevundimonas sp. DC300-4]|uniref:restriction endonuclease subunit S n=1 Tax=Brevundimonas sp. DC300-4 TaxID=2804594 RepID=UPI003CE8069D
MNARWHNRPLGELCDVIAGQSPRGSALNKSGDGLPFYQGKKDYTEKKIGPPTVWTTEVTKEAKAGDILMSVRAPVGPVNYATQRICIGRGLAAIRPKSIDTDYLFYLLTAKQSEISGREGAVFASINRDEIKRIVVPAPPLDEQKRIVAILDEAFEGIAAAVTIDRKNAQSASRLSSQALSAEFRNAENAVGTVALRQLCSFENGDRGENYPNKSARVLEGIPFINAGHLSNRRVNMSGMDYISSERFDLLRSGKPKDRDVLFCLRGSLGKFGIVDGIGDCAIASSLVIVRPNTSTLSDYIAAYFESGICADMIETYRSGTAQPNLGAKQLASFRIPALSQARQAELVERTTAVSRECRELVDIYDKKLAALAELKQSLLARAFSGELTREPIAA